MNVIHHARPKARRTARPNAFTLVEVLAVVLILGILAALVVPSFSNATDMARVSTLQEELRFMRSQTVGYISEHYGVAPGYPGGISSATPTEATFIAQMTTHSTAHGATSATANPLFPFGPYLRRMPTNPFNGENGVLVIANGGAIPTDGDDSTGWIYKPQTNQFLSNAAGTDPAGKKFIEY